MRADTWTGNRVGLLAILANLCIPTAIAVEASANRYEVLVERDFRISMRDGAELVADAYRPAKAGRYVEGKFPVILIRTCYDKDNRRGVFLFDAAYFAQ